MSILCGILRTEITCDIFTSIMYVFLLLILQNCSVSGEGFLIPDYGIDIIAFIGIKDEKDIEYEEVCRN